MEDAVVSLDFLDFVAVNTTVNCIKLHDLKYQQDYFLHSPKCTDFFRIFYGICVNLM